MNNIIKAMNYQIVRDNATIYAFLLGIGMLCLSFTDTDFGTLTASGFIVNYSVIIFLIIALFILIMASRISGWDFNDKTMNYEILSGHSRKDVYWSRVTVSLLWSVISCFILIPIPVIIVSIIKGWDSGMDLNGVLLRYILLIFPIFRVTCEIILLTFIVKNCFKSMVLGYILIELEILIPQIISETTDLKFTYHLSLSNINTLMDFSNYRMGFIDGKDVMIFETALDTSFIIGTIAVSIISGIVCLLLGYAYFKKTDLN